MSATETLDLVTQAEAARMLGVSRQYVHRLVVDGRVPDPIAVLHASRAPLWRRDDVERWIAKHRAQGTPLARLDGQA